MKRLCWRFSNFTMLAPQATGVVYFIEAARVSGMGAPHVSELKDGDYSICIVRHPVNWLTNLYENWRTRWGCVDSQLFEITSLLKDVQSLDEFVGKVARLQGAVGRAFSQYDASQAVRREDFPESLEGLFLTMGASDVSKINDVCQVYPLTESKTRVSKAVQMDLYRAERDFFERYEYWVSE